MARAPNPKMVEAKKLFDQGMLLVDIAKKLEVPDGTVRRWKHDHDWDGKKKKKQSERSGEKKKEKANVRKPRGAPLGNKNAVGNNGGAPAGNTNALKHGGYSEVYWDMLDDEEQELIEGVPTDEELLLMEQIRLFTVRERRIMKAINNYRNTQGGLYVAGVMRTESKRTFKNPEEEKLYDDIQSNKVKKGEILPGKGYQITTSTAATVDVINRLEKELTAVQGKKTAAIQALTNLRLEKEKLSGGQKGNDLVRAWAEKVMQTRRDSSGE